MTSNTNVISAITEMALKITDRYWVWPEVPETDYSSVTALQPLEDMSRIGIIDTLTW